MSFGRRMRGSQDIYWPAFVDVFMVLLAVAVLAAPIATPLPLPGPICAAPNRCVAPLLPPPIKPEMTLEQFEDKRLACRTRIAADEIRRVLTVVAPVPVGASIMFTVPPPPAQLGNALPERTEQVADSLVESIFHTDLRLRLEQQPTSIRLAGVSVQAVFSRKDEATSAAYAEQLQDYLAEALRRRNESFRVTHNFIEPPSQRSPQVWINVLMVLLDEAKTQATTDWEKGQKPCPISPKS